MQQGIIMSKAIEEFEFSIEKIESVNIPTMYKMSEEEYVNYIKADNLLYIDHY